MIAAFDLASFFVLFPGGDAPSPVVQSGHVQPMAKIALPSFTHFRLGRRDDVLAIRRASPPAGLMT